MAIAATLSVDKPTPLPGDTVTFTVAVTGNDGQPATPPLTDSVNGVVRIGAQDFTVGTTVTLPGKPAVPPLPETYGPLTDSAGALVFTQSTTNPRVFTARIP